MQESFVRTIGDVFWGYGERRFERLGSHTAVRNCPTLTVAQPTSRPWEHQIYRKLHSPESTTCKLSHLYYTTFCKPPLILLPPANSIIIMLRSRFRSLPSSSLSAHWQDHDHRPIT